MNRPDQARRTVLHRLDPRLKVAALLLFSLLLSGANPHALLIMTLFAIALSVQTRFHVSRALLSSRAFLLLLTLTVIARSLFSTKAPLYQWGPLTFSISGMAVGITICWRLLLMLWLALWLLSVTRSDEINAAIRWFLKPLPFINADTVGIMLSFLMRFIPIIIKEHHNITQAGRARLIDNNPNPLLRIRNQVIPLMRNLFKTGDQFALAMTSRCYSADRTDPDLTFEKRDIVALLVLLVMCIILIGGKFPAFYPW